MTNLIHWIGPGTMQALGWALVHFLWQGTALAALAAVLMATIRRSAARYLIGVITLGLMLLAPVATFLSYSQQPLKSSEPVKISHFAAPTVPTANANAQLTRPAQPLQLRSLDAFP